MLMINTNVSTEATKEIYHRLMVFPLSNKQVYFLSQIHICNKNRCVH